MKEYRERKFKLELIKKLESLGWKCFLHEKEEGCHSFSMSKCSGYPNIYCITPIKEFPIVAIETKVPQKLGDFTNGFWQSKDYVKEFLSAKYLIDNKEVEKPKIILFASPSSIEGSYFYLWKMPHDSEQERIVGSTYLLLAFNRLFWDIGGAILQNNFFQYKNKNYYLNGIDYG